MLISLKYLSSVLWFMESFEVLFRSFENFYDSHLPSTYRKESVILPHSNLDLSALIVQFWERYTTLFSSIWQKMTELGVAKRFKDWEWIISRNHHLAATLWHLFLDFQRCQHGQWNTCEQCSPWNKSGIRWQRRNTSSIWQSVFRSVRIRS